MEHADTLAFSGVFTEMRIMTGKRGDLRALLLAAVGAPAVASAILGFVALAIWLGLELISGRLSWLPLMVGTAAFLYSALIAIPISLTLGVATHVIFQKRRIVSASAYVYAGIATAILVAAFSVALSLPWSDTYPSTSNWKPLLGALGWGSIICGIPVGWLTGYFAWLIRRPDRDPVAESAIRTP